MFTMYEITNPYQGVLERQAYLPECVRIYARTCTRTVLHVYTHTLWKLEIQCLNSSCFQELKKIPYCHSKMKTDLENVPKYRQ